MIEAIIKTIDNQLKGLDWVDIYGGLTETWERYIETTNGNAKETFPVTRGTMMANCGEDCQNLLTPDNTKKNVLFWTLLNDAVPSIPDNISRANRPVRYTQSARLIVWLNFTACDVCDYSAYAYYAALLMEMLNNARFIATTPVGISGRMKVASMPTKDYRTVFSEWTFGLNQELFTWPYDFFALDVNFEWITNEVCTKEAIC